MKPRIRMIAVMVLLAILPEAHAEKAKPFVFKPANGTGPFPVALWFLRVDEGIRQTPWNSSRGEGHVEALPRGVQAHSSA